MRTEARAFDACRRRTPVMSAVIEPAVLRHVERMGEAALVRAALSVSGAAGTKYWRRNAGRRARRSPAPGCVD
jgi:hypothetical protein